MRKAVPYVVLILSCLLGFCIHNYLTARHTSSMQHLSILKIALCKGVFHYGIHDLPLPCRARMPQAYLNLSGPVRPTVVPPTNNNGYEALEYLHVNLSSDSPSLLGRGLNNNSSASFDGGGNTSQFEMPPHNGLLTGASSDVTTMLPLSTSTLGSSGPGGQSVDFSNLYPAVIECFVIILCGYVAGRSNIISQTEAKGLNTFVSFFSLPALIFMSMAKLDFSSVNWLFLMAICLAKSVVFALVAIVTLLVQRPTNYGKAGLYAIFCTQSNDFALGYPILEALYGQTHPEFPSYLYLLAPISLVLLNPIGFMLMEIGKRTSQQEDGGGSTSRRTSVTSTCNTSGQHGSGDAASGNDDSLTGSSSGISAANSASNNGGGGVTRRRFCFAGKILQGILLNPVVLMTLLGILGNVVFDHKLPSLLHGVLKSLGQAFSASALFALGVRMVGKVASLRGSLLVLPGILIAVKTIMLPLVARELVSLLKPGGDSRNTTADYSNYGFLYGTFPTAPSVFVYAAHYNVQPDLIASSMVAVTFLSAPLMLISAKMVALVHINPMDYVKELESFLFHVSIVGLIASAWVVLVFLLSRKWRKVPHCITLCLAVSQCMASAGALLWAVMDCTSPWKLYLQFGLVSWGVFSARFFTALLAATLFLLRIRTLPFVLAMRPVLVLIGFGVPGALVLVLVLVVQREMDISDKHEPNFQYGTTQAVVALLLLWFTLFTTIVCLILQQRQQKRFESYSTLSDARHNDDLTPLNPDHSGGEGETEGLLPSDCSELDDLASTDSDSLFSPTEELRPASSHCRRLKCALSEQGAGGGAHCSGSGCNASSSSKSSRSGGLHYRSPQLLTKLQGTSSSSGAKYLESPSDTAAMSSEENKITTLVKISSSSDEGGGSLGGEEDISRSSSATMVLSAGTTNDLLANSAGNGTYSSAKNGGVGSSLLADKIADETRVNLQEQQKVNTYGQSGDREKAGLAEVQRNAGEITGASISNFDADGPYRLGSAGVEGGDSVPRHRTSGTGGHHSSPRRQQRRSTRLTLPQEDTILRDRDDEFQMMRHVVLLLFLCGSMVVGFGLCLWTLVSEEASGVYVEMVFLDAVLNYGQGIFTAVIFGLDTRLVVLPLLRWYRRLVHGAATLQLPPLSALPLEDRQTCDQFTRYHMDKCCRDIVRDRRWRLQRLRGVFGGQELVDWLLLVGLANDRTHAVRYGRALLSGRVIRHIEDAYHFHDQPVFYTFCSYQQEYSDQTPQDTDAASSPSLLTNPE